MNMKLQMVRGMVAAVLLSGVGVSAMVQAQRPAPATVCTTSAKTRAVLLPTVVVTVKDNETATLPRLANSNASLCQPLIAAR